MATRVLWSINNYEVQGSQIRTKTLTTSVNKTIFIIITVIIIFIIIVMKSGAPLLGLAKSI